MAKPVSVVVVSRDRPDHLIRCLRGLSQQTHPKFEVIVAACPRGIAAAAPYAQRAKLIPFDRPNISAARNRGIAAAAGAVVCFIDDDAVPEPLWLDALVAGMAQTGAACASGRVLGRNGISTQWEARVVDALGRSSPAPVPSAAPSVIVPPIDHAARSEGTNMAIRRPALVALGGFDAAFAFYLDETDVNLRAAQAGLQTAYVPDAVVHHGVAASAHRRPDRTPRDLFEIGASQAVFLRKHAARTRWTEALAAFEAAQRARLIRAMVRGGLGADDVARLMVRLRAGIAAGQTRALDQCGAFDEPPAAFEDFGAVNAGHRGFVASLTGRRSAWQAARKWVSQGGVASLFLFSPTALYHRVQYLDDGIWLQIGGIWGKSVRDGPLLQPGGLRARADAEMARVVPVRGPGRVA